MEMNLNGMRDRRRQLGITLDRLSQMTGYSAGYLSQMERNVKTPTLEALETVALALDADPALLLGGPAPAREDFEPGPMEYALFRAGRPLYAPDGGRMLSPPQSGESSLHAVAHVLRQGGRLDFSGREGKEQTVLFCVRGSVCLEAAGEGMTLEIGDSVTLRGGVGYEITHAGAGDGEVLRFIVG